MPNGFIITEETPDRNYFTIVPNYIVNHSTVYEQGIYLVMKRIAGENGNCYASHQTIADKAGISRPTVSKTIQKLIKRNWIKETGTKVGKTLSTKQYQIVDLWELNNRFYKEEAVNHRTSSKDKLSTTEQLSCKRPLHKEDIYNKKKDIVNTVVLTSNEVAGKEINSLIKYFEPLNPAYKLLYNNKTQKDSLKRLADLHGVEKVIRMLEMLPDIVSQPYAPRITTPYQLENKLGDLKLFMAQRKNKKGGIADGTNL